jgi:hypothetical protein
MKTMLTKPLLLAIAILGSTPATQAQTTVAEAITKLREAQNYSWTKTTEMPGAPFSVAPVSGKAAKDGYAIQVAKADGNSLQVVTKAGRAAAKVGNEWKTAAELEAGKGKASADLAELVVSRTPADELQALASKVVSPQQDADGSWGGKLDAAEAKSIMSGLLKHRARRPNMEISSTSGSLRVWMKDGLPQKYVVTTSGSISRPFGSKEVTRTATVTISEVGSTTVEIPAGAKAKLQSAAP